MSQSLIEILIKATDKASGPVNAAEKSLGKFKLTTIDTNTQLGKLAGSTLNLKEDINRLYREVESATPENLKFARSFQSIKEDLDSGKIGIVQAKSELSYLRREMGITDQQTVSLSQKLDNAGSAFNEMKGSILVATAAATAFAGTVFGIYKFAEAGAKLEATEQRFDLLAQRIGTSGDALMTKLVPAIDGLVSRSDAMATATELIGLGLVKTEDQAVRLTRVVAQLGMDTNQLVLTLANQTTMRFDQLGVGVDGFDEKLDALKATGMDVNAAFTEAFLQQAEEQIIKVGSVADTAAGSYLKMNAAVKDLYTNLQKLASIGLKPVISPLSDFVSIAADGAKNYTRLIEAVAEGDITLGEAAYMLLSNSNGTIRLYTALDDLEGKVIGNTQYMSAYYQAQLQATKATEDLTGKVEAFTLSEEDLQKAQEGLLPWQLEINKQQQEMAAAERQAAEDGYNLKVMIDDYATATEKATVRTEELKMALVKFGIDGKLGDIFTDYKSDLDDLQIKHDELTKELDKLIYQGWSPLSKKVLDVKDALKENEQAQLDAAEAMKEATRQLIFQQAAAGLDAEATLALAREMGLVDEKSYALAIGLQTAKEAYDRNRDGVLDASEATQGYIDKVGTLNDLLSRVSDKYAKVVIDVVLNASPAALKAMSQVFQAGGDIPGLNINLAGEVREGFGVASGGAFDVPAGFPNDTYGPMWLTSGEHVEVTPPGQTARSGSMRAEIPINIYLDGERILSKSFARQLKAQGVPV